jgi:hypothetical protein
MSTRSPELARASGSPTSCQGAAQDSRPLTTEDYPASLSGNRSILDIGSFWRIGRGSPSLADAGPVAGRGGCHARRCGPRSGRRRGGSGRRRRLRARLRRRPRHRRRTVPRRVQPSCGACPGGARNWGVASHTKASTLVMALVAFVSAETALITDGRSTPPQASSRTHPSAIPGLTTGSCCSPSPVAYTFRP